MADRETEPVAEASPLQQEEEEEEQSSVETVEPDEGSEEPDEVMKPARPLLSTRSMSTVDPDDDYPNMTVYRKVRAGALMICWCCSEGILWSCAALLD